MSEKQILFPVGRYVGGSLYKSNTVTNKDGSPKLNAAGQPRKNWSFGVALRKTAGQDWKQTAWGVVIVQAAVEGYPNGETGAPSFAWKVTDGDSTVPNKKGNKPCDNDGWPGHWVLWFSSEAQAPKLTGKYGAAADNLLYADGVERIKPGHMIEVLGTVKDNKPSDSPGVYLNYRVVAHNDDTTPVIELRAQIDTTSVGFGGGGAPAPAPVAPPAAPAPAAPAAPTVVTPNTAMLAPPPPVTPPAPPAGPQMTAAANGTTYEAYRASGWTDDQLRQHGLMV